MGDLPSARRPTSPPTPPISFRFSIASARGTAGDPPQTGLGAWHGWIPSVNGPGRDVGANAGSAAHHGPSADFQVVGDPHTPSENHAVADDHATRKTHLAT